MSEKIQENEEGGAAPEAPAEAAPAAPSPEHDQLKDDLVAALKTVFDPEIPVDIYELGLIYRLDVDPERNIEVDMTLTAPGCPVAGDMPGWVENAVASVPGVGQVKVNLVFDPEIPADIYELGLIYKVDIKDDRAVDVDMTLTTPNCPAAAELPIMVENAVASVAGVGPVKVQVVWDPPWDPSRMSDEARLVLNMW